MTSEAIEALIEAARRAEREACAAIADQRARDLDEIVVELARQFGSDYVNERLFGQRNEAEGIAYAIRARSKSSAQLAAIHAAEANESDFLRRHAEGIEEEYTRQREAREFARD
jgi:hypothetical protein